MKFNVGDHVVVREWDDMADEFGLTDKGDIDCYKIFTSDMKQLCGEELVVSFVTEGFNTDGYRLKPPKSEFILPWKFSDDMLKPANNSEEVMFDSSWVDEMLTEVT